MEVYNNKILSFPVDNEGFNYIRRIIIELSSRFPLDVRDSIELINSRLKHTKLIGEDIFYHDTPEAWSKHFYWGDHSMWWKKGEERYQYNLPDLKPIRTLRKGNYELWNDVGSEESEEILFFPDFLLDDLLTHELLPLNYIKVWETEATSYNQALELLYKHMGWGNYREEG
jgi:hypothetical protein